MAAAQAEADLDTAMACDDTRRSPLRSPTAPVGSPRSVGSGLDAFLEGPGFLRQRPKPSPEQERTLGLLLYRFLEFYGHFFRNDAYGISVREGGFYYQLDRFDKATGAGTSFWVVLS